MNTQNSEFVRIITTISNRVQQFVDIVAPYAEPVARGLVSLAKWDQITKVLNAAGWLPHYTTPLSLVEDCSSDAYAVRSKLNEYYEQKWSCVRRTIESSR